jgi:hypothetical protein
MRASLPGGRVCGAIAVTFLFAWFAYGPGLTAHHATSRNSHKAVYTSAQRAGCEKLVREQNASETEGAPIPQRDLAGACEIGVAPGIPMVEQPRLSTACLSVGALSLPNRSALQRRPAGTVSGAPRYLRYSSFLI